MSPHRAKSAGRDIAASALQKLNYFLSFIYACWQSNQEIFNYSYINTAMSLPTHKAGKGDIAGKEKYFVTA